MARTKLNSPRLRNIVKSMKRGYVIVQQRKSAGRVVPGSNYLFNVAYPPQYPYPYPYPPQQEKPKEEEKPEERVVFPGGIDIRPKGGVLKNPPLTLGTEKSVLRGVNLSYNLIPRRPEKGEKVYAYANIKWDPGKHELIYSVIEPQISEWDREMIEKVKRELEERLDVDFFKIGEIKAKNLLRDEITKIIAEERGIDAEKKDTLIYYIERDIVNLGKIAPLMNDPNIEDISCDGVNIPIYVYHRDPKIGSIKTNIAFENSENLNKFSIKLAQKCRKTVNIAEPLLDATLPDGSRTQITLGTDIARKGSNFTIRKFTEFPLTPTHMLSYGTVDSTQMAYLWLAIENGQSVLISGGTATGKTSMLNALSLFIRPSLKVVSIEDTAELRLPHPHWVPEVARTPLSETDERGDVTLFDLLKSSLRQRPDYIVMGEVRGKEAFVLFQQMATGHPSIATIHAASIQQLMDRLTTPPISLPPTLIENVNVILFLITTRSKENYVRRLNNIIEVVGIEKDVPRTKDVFRWDSLNDMFKITDKSLVLQNIALRQGFTEDAIKQELMRRKMIMEWMLAENIMDYKEFAKVVSTYYTSPDKLINLIREKYDFFTS
jgi:flagellar protein FlaI